MELAELLPLLADHRELIALRQRIAKNGTRSLRLGPLLGSARSLVIAQQATADQALLVLTATLDQAAQLYEDICSWVEDEQQVGLFPSTDALAYEHMSVGEDVIGGRLRIIQALLTAPAPLRVIVAPVKALMQPTMSPSDLHWAMRRLAVGQQADPRELTTHWQRIGYQNRALVEAVGEWSLRGGIIDIWPPTHSLPLRIEFFGDEIESLRRFDPLSQRSERRERTVEIGPPHDIPFWQHDVARANIARLDLERLRPEVQTEWHTNIEHLEQGQHFEGRAFFTPLFFPDGGLHSLLDHLPADTRIMLYEARAIRQAADELQGRAEATRETQIAEGELPPTYPSPYLPGEAIIEPAGRPVIDLSNQPADGAGNDGWTHVDTAELFQPANRWGGQLDRALEDVAARLAAGEQVLVVSPQSGRIAELWAERPPAETQPEDEDHADAGQVPEGGTLTIIHGSLSGGWTSATLRTTLLTDTELFGFVARRPVVTRRKRQQREIDRQAFLQQLVPGDHVVHIEHGIAIYEGLRNIQVDDKEREYLHLRYAAGDALYVPVDQIDRVSKYIGGSDSTPALNRLGSADWERVKRKVKAAVEELARELLDLYAARQVAERPPYAPDSQWQRELEDSFPYVETDDQLDAIEAIKHDLLLPRPMDRLICGDVGYGKTEVAIRAAFKVVQDGKQVAVLVPTTVLAQQHYETFRKRMAAFPVEIEMLSRFRSPKEQKAITDRLQKGQIDIVIGTHRLLSKDIQFRELGLVVVDEEQRFGVKHKERLKTLRTAVDVLTLTATPIPRTLHMAMAGMRDMSVIDTPPEDRVPIKTYVVPYEDHLVRDAIMREIGRGGQVFFVHNRVHSIYSLLARLHDLLPEVRFLVGHGQMEEKELERVMVQFFAGGADVLISTTIIESGLDVPRANTIIIDDAPNYGLAQLYQLRGRVGRSTQRAYAYLLYHPAKRITGDAQQRLEAIQEATELGAGFRIAMRDLEIRGAGNLLGPEQSGNIAAVGFDLYTQLLAQAVEQSRPAAARAATAKGERRDVRDRSVTAREEMRRAGAVAALPAPAARGDGNGNSPVTPIPLVSLDLPLTAFLPTDYITDDALRLRVYQKLAQATTSTELRQLRAELKDRFGDPPPPAEQLLTWLELKVLAIRAGVASIATNEEEIAVRLPENRVLDRVGLSKLASPEQLRLGPQFARIGRRAAGDGWISLLQKLLLALGTMTP